jgi:hypothetical protein
VEAAHQTAGGLRHRVATSLLDATENRRRRRRRRRRR